MELADPATVAVVCAVGSLPLGVAWREVDSGAGRRGSDMGVILLTLGTPAPPKQIAMAQRIMLLDYRVDQPPD